MGNVSPTGDGSDRRRPVTQGAERRLGFGGQITLSCLWLGLNFQSGALLAIVIPAQVLTLVEPGTVGSARQAGFLSALSLIAATVALLTQPLAGAASDRTGGRWGRRRPYLLVGAALLFAGLAGLAGGVTVAAFVAAFVVNQVGYNVAQAAYQAMLPDRVPGDQRGSASGYLGLMTILGSVGSLALAGFMLGSVTQGADLAAEVRMGSAIYYAVSALVLAATLLVTLIWVRERPALRRRTPLGLAEWIRPLRHDNFRWVFLARCSVMLGISLFLTYIEYYMAQVAGAGRFVLATAVVAVLALGGALVGALVAGIASDRTGRVPLVFVATAAMGLAALAFTADQGEIPLPALGIAFGLGYGAYYSVDWALAVDSLPDPDAAGKDMGIWNLATNVPSILAPFVGGVVIGLAAIRAGTVVGYRLVFAVAAATLLLGGLLILRVRETGERPAEERLQA